MTDENYRVGLVGAGVWSDVQLAAWAEVTGARVVALCDRHPERREPLREKYGIARGFDDFASMLASGAIDVVDICTRPGTHAAFIRLAAERGLPVLCQKPFCTTLNEAQATSDLCARAKTPLMINENFRWQPWFRHAHALLAAGRLGAPFAASFRHRSSHTMPCFQHRQAYMKDMPELVVYELGVHFLDTTRFLFGQPATVAARVQRVSPDIAGEDVTAILLGYPALTVTLNLSWASVPALELDQNGDGAPPANRIEIEGTVGTLLIATNGDVALHRRDGLERWPFPSRDGLPRSRAAAQQHFVDCLKSGRRFETDGPDTLETMALVYGVYRAARENRVVTLDPVVQG